jgi:hypothetical protein
LLQAKSNNKIVIHNTNCKSIVKFLDLH